MQDIKKISLQRLTANEPSGRKKDAARLLSGCTVDVRYIENDQDPHTTQNMVDVILHADPETVDCAHKGPEAGLIENAIRESLDVPMRHLQWVETKPADSQKTGAGAGEYQAKDQHTSKAQPGQPPKPAYDPPGYREKTDV